MTLHRRLTATISQRVLRFTVDDGRSKPSLFLPKPLVMFLSNIEDRRATSKLVTVSRADGQNIPGAQEHRSTEEIEGPPGEYRPFFFFHIIWRVQSYGYGALIANLISSIDHTTTTSP